MKPFYLADWFWFVGAGDNPTRAYSSAARDYVVTSDPAFIAFIDAGGVATRIDTEFNLGGAIAALPLTQAPIPAGILDGYAAARAADEFSLAWLDHENRIRALEGAPPITGAPAAIEALKAAILQSKV